MKKETARREIEALDYYLQNHTNDYSEESHMAMMMAIKTLEQEPCEDAVSRQAVLDGIDTYINKAQSTGIRDDFISFAELVVKDLPSVNPQKIGHWKPFDLTFGRNYYYCTSCEHGTNMETVFKYCPNCGAKMVEPQESEVSK